MTDLETKIDKKKEKNSFINRMFNKKKLQKPQIVAVLYVRKNGTAQPFETEAKKGFFSIDDRTYHIDKDCRFNLIIGKERIPFFMQFEDGLTPMPNSEYYENVKTLDEFKDKVAEAQNMAIRAIRHAELVRAEGADKPKINPKVAIGIAIVIIIGLAIFRSYSG